MTSTPSGGGGGGGGGEGGRSGVRQGTTCRGPGRSLPWAMPSDPILRSALAIGAATGAYGLSYGVLAGRGGCVGGLDGPAAGLGPRPRAGPRRQRPPRRRSARTPPAEADAEADAGPDAADRRRRGSPDVVVGEDSSAAEGRPTGRWRSVTREGDPGRGSGCARPWGAIVVGGSGRPGLGGRRRRRGSVVRGDGARPGASPRSAHVGRPLRRMLPARPSGLPLCQTLDAGRLESRSAASARRSRSSRVGRGRQRSCAREVGRPTRPASAARASDPRRRLRALLAPRDPCHRGRRDRRGVGCRPHDALPPLRFQGRSRAGLPRAARAALDQGWLAGEVERRGRPGGAPARDLRRLRRVVPRAAFEGCAFIRVLLESPTGTSAAAPAPSTWPGSATS